MLVGRLFHARARVTRNDRSPMVLSRIRGTTPTCDGRTGRRTDRQLIPRQHSVARQKSLASLSFLLTREPAYFEYSFGVVARMCCGFTKVCVGLFWYIIEFNFYLSVRKCVEHQFVNDPIIGLINRQLNDSPASLRTCFHFRYWFSPFADYQFQYFFL